MKLRRYEFDRAFVVVFGAACLFSVASLPPLNPSPTTMNVFMHYALLQHRLVACCHEYYCFVRALGC